MEGSSQVLESGSGKVDRLAWAKGAAIPPRHPSAALAEMLIPDGPRLRHLSAEDRRLFREFGSGRRTAPRHKVIHAAFEEYACRQPGAVAVRHRRTSMSYGRLNAEANRLANVLSEHGVRRGDTVALYLKRSIPMVVGILATLKVGGAYVPQHVGVTPSEMLRHITGVTGSRVILTLSTLANQIPADENQTVLAIDEIMRQPLSEPKAAPSATLVHPSDRCFVLFTSGTTGTPNGVQVTHRNLCNILQTAPGDLGIRPGLIVAQLLSIAFDMAAWEILGCLSNGGTLLIRSQDIQETAELSDVVIATPSILSSIDETRCRNVKVVAVAGEPCPRPLADTWSQFRTFYNSCGPTETTIVNTAERHYPAKPTLSIGRPTPNNTVYVLDNNLRPCPIGDVGEMWAGGDCVSDGYLGNEDLNRERYHPDPFLGGGRRMFRTRDLGRWTMDGEIEHFGRVDDQVKIRGFRVELDSVSAVLESVAGCRHAATLKFDDRSLVAFVTPATVDTGLAGKAIAEHLPYYCVPTFIIPLDALPRTQRGKIDKRALMTIAGQRAEKIDVAVA